MKILLICKVMFPGSLHLLEWLRLQGQAALQTHSFRDAEPQRVIPPNAKNHHGVSPKRPGPGIIIHLTNADSCLPSIAWQCSAVCYSKSSQLGPRNVRG